MIKSERQQSENALQPNGHAVHRPAPPAAQPTQQNTTHSNVKSPGRTVSPGLMQSVGGAAATESHKEEEEEAASEPAPKDVVHNTTRNATDAKRAKKQFVLVYNDQQRSPEERRAAFTKTGVLEKSQAQAQLSQ